MTSSTDRSRTYADACATPSNTTGYSAELSPTTMDSPARPSTSTAPDTNAPQPISNADSASTPIQLTEVNVSEGARVFHKFSHFPKELKLKIWGFAASIPRVIELDNHSDATQVGGDGQRFSYVRVAPNSRIPPALLHVSHEARSESSKYYQLTNFENKKPQWGFSSEHYIYYNPRADIVYFGENSEFSTLVTVLRKGLEIPNLAVVHSFRWVRRAWQSAPNLTLLQILHGIEQEIIRSQQWLQGPWVAGFNSWPGCNGLKKLLLILPSGKAQSLGGNSRSVHFQKATDAALAEHFAQEEGADTLTVTSSQHPAFIRRQILPTTAEVANLNQGVEFETLGKNRWEGDEKPTVMFASIGKGPLLEEVSHTIFVAATVINKKILEHDNYALTRDIAAQTGCSIEVSSEPAFVPPERDVQGRLVVAAAALAPVREVTFFGNWEEIRIAEAQFGVSLRVAQALHR